MKKLSRFIFTKLMGWKVIDHATDIPKCVMAIAPHTSNHDFIVGKLAYSSLGRTANFLMKKEWFFFPFNLIFKSMGGIPVHRQKNNSMTDAMAAEFAKHDHLHLAITPEGTRKPVKKWKRGFYYIAMKAEVPIMLVALDYGKKEATVMDIFHPTGDYDADIVKIRAYYKDVTAKKPENFIP